MKDKYKFLQPTYYKDFRCSGSSCKINCCSYNWKISVDKQTYLYYKTIKEPDYFVSLLNKYVKRDRTSKNSLSYAKIVHKKELTKLDYTLTADEVDQTISEYYNVSSCPFQDKDGLCEIHKNLGEKGLCYTCQSYPRNVNNIFNNYERSLVIGCEEVSKLLYSLEDGICFELVEDDKSIKYNYVVDLSKNKNRIINYFDDIRLVCLQLLQLRNYSLDDRMILLSILMLKIDELSNNNKYDDIPLYLNSFFDNISIYEDILKIDKQNQSLPLNMSKNIMSSNLKSSGTKEFCMEMKIGFLILEKAISEIDDNNMISTLYNEFKENRSKLMKEKEYFIENIFVNLFFSKGFPFNGSNSVKECCTIFISYYIFYKSLLSVYLSNANKLEEDLLHKISTLFGRMCADQPIKLPEILSYVKENNLDNLAHLAILIKSS